ncbi:hypothetical protein KUA55_16475 [Enterococcus sp. ALS3]|uniref:Uncharacterized protein n=1 Tax=Enterococcus alishanensis TaxID=1303817 RepID=A0ABS6THK8_9ENTE|nr:hypothetical protein [Enterococcus alishanensis]MBV7392280.1 hypothetical protein [Enterococcus alishanensis]
MEKQPFTCRQLLNRDYQKIQRQVTKYYRSTPNLILCLKIIQALLIRRNLAAEKLALPLVEIVKEIYLKNPATPDMAVEIYQFGEYFTAREWHILMEKYHQLVRLYIFIKILGEILKKRDRQALFLSG